MTKTPDRVRIRKIRKLRHPQNGGGTIAQLKRWVENDFGRKFVHITRVVDRPRKAIVFKMWGPTLMYTITAWEKGGNPFGFEPIPKTDGIMASCSLRYYQDGEDWNRGNDMSDGPLNKKTWDRISHEIRGNAIHTLPPIESTRWLLFNKGTTRDMIKAGVEIKLTPTLKGAAEARQRRLENRKRLAEGKTVKTKHGTAVKTKDGKVKIMLNKKKAKKIAKKAKKVKKAKKIAKKYTPQKRVR
jgi:hypothetical protein